MKKIILISLLGPIFAIIFRIIELIKKLSLHGLNGTYDCAISIYEPCSFLAYAFKGDEAVISYAFIIMSFILLCIITSYILFLIKLYKTAYKLFWVFIILTTIIIIAFPFVSDYIQLIY